MSNVIKTYKCPICKKLFTDDKYAPFCSKRCADVDLGRWFNGSYAVPLVEPDEADAEELNEIVDRTEHSNE